MINTRAAQAQARKWPLAGKDVPVMDEQPELSGPGGGIM